MGGIHYLVENVSSSDVVLDVGSKTGDDMGKLCCETVAIDLAFQSTERETDYALADGTSLPFETNSFDYVLCSQVLEHVKNTNGIIEEIARVLRPTGEAVFNFPNRLAPKAPHSPPWWYSYLPRRLGEHLSDALLDEETAEYYRTSEFMLTPLKSRWYLEKHFETVEYHTFEYKQSYQNELRDELNSHYHRVVFSLTPVLARLENTPIFGWLIELCYSNVSYICSETRRDA